MTPKAGRQVGVNMENCQCLPIVSTVWADKERRRKKMFQFTCHALHHRVQISLGFFSLSHEACRNVWQRTTLDL